MSEINFDYIFIGLDGKQQREMIVDEDKEGNAKRDFKGIPFLKKGDFFTLKKACINVLINPPIETDRTGRQKEYKAEEKIEMAMLAQKIYAGTGEVELDADDIVFLCKLLNLRYRNPLTIQQAYKILDPKNKILDQNK